MYIRLTEKAVLRGWNDMPRTIVERQKVPKQDTDDGIRLPWRMSLSPMVFSKEEYSFIKKLDGHTEFDKLTQTEQETLDKLLERGYAYVSDTPMEPLDLDQRYIGYKTYHMVTCKWAITGKCNYNCKHCFVSAPKGESQEPGLDKCREIVHQMYNCGVYNVKLTGGEPLVRRDFDRVVDLLTEYGIGIHTIFSNGSLINDSVLDHLEKRGHHPEFQISFDGTDGCHDKLRGVAGAEKDAIRAIKLLTGRGYSVTALMCLHKGNAHTLRETAKLMGEMGVTEFATSITREFGLWENEARELSLSPEELKDICLSYIPQYFEDGMPVSFNYMGAFTWEKHESEFNPGEVHSMEKMEELKDRVICETARCNAYISPEGRLMPCMNYAACGFADRFPSLFEMPLSKALTDSFASQIMTEKLGKYLERNEKCKTCPKFPICIGGCRANGLVKGGDHLCIDEFNCYFQKNDCGKLFFDAAMKAKKNWVSGNKSCKRRAII